MKNILWGLAFLIQNNNIENIVKREDIKIIQNDDTDREMRILNSKGLRSIGHFDASGIRVNLYITNAADNIATARNFDIQDDNFNLNLFSEYIEDEYKNSIEYFKGISNRNNIYNLHLVIEDLGEERRYTVSQTRVNTRIIEIDIRRWHKIYRGRRPYLADLTSIHEFTHINNYTLDDNEERLHRELAAIIFESLNYVRENGEEAYLNNYLNDIVGGIENPESVLSNEYTGMVPLRHIVRYLINRTIDGSYRLGDDKLDKLEELAYSYLSDEDNGNKGFNDACLQIDLRDSNNNILTLERIRADLYKELIENKE